MQQNIRKLESKPYNLVIVFVVMVCSVCDSVRNNVGGDPSPRKPRKYWLTETNYILVPEVIFARQLTELSTGILRQLCKELNPPGGKGTIGGADATKAGDTAC